MSGRETRVSIVKVLLCAPLLIAGMAVAAISIGGQVASAANPVPSGELAWGQGTEGQLGNGTTTAAQTTPVAVSLPSGVTATAIAGGNESGFAIGSNKVLYAWGYGSYGELGNGTTTAAQTTPVAVSLPSGVTATAITGGDLSPDALGSDGNVYAWGYGGDGQLGNNTTNFQQTTPVAVSLPSGVTATAISSEGQTSYALGSDGNVYAWGVGTDGQLGNDTTTGTQPTPVAVSLPTGVTATAIAAYAFGAYALGSNGTLYAWGEGQYGQLGNDTTTMIQTTPVAVSLPDGVSVTAITAGAATGYALGSNGTVYAWGYGYDGECGIATLFTRALAPVAVSLPAGVTATAIGGGQHTGYAIASNGNVYAWGYGTDGELGNGTTTEPQRTPVAVSLPAGVVPTAIAGGTEGGYLVVRPTVNLTQGSPTSVAIASGAGYSGQLSATGVPTGGGSLTWTTTTGSSEVTVSPSGAVTVPTSVTTLGTVAVSGTVEDAVGDAGSWSFSLTINGTPPTITSSDEALFEQGHAGSTTVTATGNPAPTFTESGTLPTGVTLSSAGVFSGTPTRSGLFYITVTATNGVSPNAVQSFIVVVAAPPTITSANSITFAEGVADAFAVTASGYPGSTFTETGTLPTGVALSSGGVLSGTPTQLGSFPITLTASNGTSPNATQSFTLTVATSTNPAPSDELAWGSGTNGELGNGTTTSTQTTPVPVSLPSGVTATATAAETETGYAIGSNGTLYAWGAGTDGQLGNGTTTATQTSAVPVSLPAGVTPTVIAAGSLTSYALGSTAPSTPGVTAPTASSATARRPRPRPHRWPSRSRPGSPRPRSAPRATAGMPWARTAPFMPGAMARTVSSGTARRPTPRPHRSPCHCRAGSPRGRSPAASTPPTRSARTAPSTRGVTDPTASSATTRRRRPSERRSPCLCRPGSPPPRSPPEPSPGMPSARTGRSMPGRRQLGPARQRHHERFPDQTGRRLPAEWGHRHGDRCLRVHRVRHRYERHALCLGFGS